MTDDLRGSLQYIHPIRGERAFSRYQRAALYDRLRDKHPIERITVMSASHADAALTYTTSAPQIAQRSSRVQIFTLELCLNIRRERRIEIVGDPSFPSPLSRLASRLHAATQRHQLSDRLAVLRDNDRLELMVKLVGLDGLYG